jgi:hypothetical protein
VSPLERTLFVGRGRALAVVGHGRGRLAGIHDEISERASVLGVAPGTVIRSRGASYTARAFKSFVE